MARTTTRSTGHPDRPATLALVAQRAGVSPQTVSNALNAPELLAPPTLERVRRAIAELDYRPHQAARALRTRTSKLIGYGVHPMTHGRSGPVMDHFLHALSRSANEAGYRVLLFTAPAGAEYEPDCYAGLLREQPVDGFVLTHTFRGDRRPDWLRKRGIPFVAFGRPWSARPAGDWVDVDGAHGTSAAVDHLVALGHRRIAFLGWPRGSGVGDDRAGGWREAMRRHGLSVRGLRLYAENDVDAARDAVAPLLSAGTTAVVAVSDTLALGCYRALLEGGRTPGRDVAVVGFDDSSAAALLTPGLSSLRQPLPEVGHACTRLLLARIKEPLGEPEQVLLPPSLVVRESSAHAV
ncbi:LacI family DNA-binding transcriptional regulator [Streptomyces sp. JV176]|uniref:LacI family DNA-binding transcriptional regulator n=1 Tax=Streptomyces sp. JV176 TaxID=858630 RepID=UPI002E78230F|nr:LacI family DNA-binding transcriptional regulator [Streptomyces sp. JV176]MEE1802319.1 LacI family DNA-binding transcriptional regulator [Streptomyces sp. JV176]